ncbi:MAG: hypothetical protein JKY15_01285 [Deltaproteobacteria bacterium]|nr:hypothetical protein [Deltaproteobacteria bacterium]
MKYILPILLSITAFADTTPTDNYLALTAKLLELHTIDDEHLLRMIDGAEKGKAMNPILETESQIDSQKQIARQAYDNVLKDHIEATQITPWAKECLKQEAKERDEKREKQEESRLVWKNKHHRLAVGDNHACVMSRAEEVLCWGNNHLYQLAVPENLGPVQAIFPGPEYTMAISPDGLIKGWGREYDKIKLPNFTSPITNVFPGKIHSCLEQKNKDIICWWHYNGGLMPVSEYSTVSRYDKKAFLAKQYNDSSHHPYCIQLLTPRPGSRCSSQAKYPNFNSAEFISFTGHSVRDDYCLKNSGENSVRCTLVGHIFDFEDVETISSSEFAVCLLHLSGRISCLDPNSAQSGSTLTDLKHPDLNFQGEYISVGIGWNFACALHIDGSVECQGIHNGYGVLNPPKF